MNEQDKKPYEVSFLVRNEDGVASIIKHLTLSGAEILNEGELKEIELAYPIEKDKIAYFGFLHCNIPQESMDGIHNGLKLDSNVIRMLIISAPTNKEKQDKFMRAKNVARTSRITGDREFTQRPKKDTVISNDLLEEKLEEILK